MGATPRKPLVLILLAIPVVGRPETPPAPALVERVVDGDTVVVRLDGQSIKVRLIGVDAPESVDPRKPVQRFGHEAAEFLRGLIEGKRVRLAYEPAGARVDRYGRLLAYLYLERGLFVNREIVAKGYGFAYVKYPFQYMDDFRQAERVAREKGLGLWGPDPPKPSTDEVVYVTKTGAKYHRAGGRAVARVPALFRSVRSPGDTPRAWCAIRRSYRDASSPSFAQPWPDIGVMSAPSVPSRTIRRRARRPVRMAGMYVKLYHYRDEFAVIDDVDALYSDRSGVRLLKCLCQTEEEKAVTWHSDARGLEREGIPREFTTTSRVVIICNDWKTLNRNVAALQDRGHVLLFQPGAAEVHAQAAKWFDDLEIYHWFGTNLHRMREPSLRHYVRARELKGAGMDWTDVLAAEDENPRAWLAAELLASDAYGSAAERVQAFVAQGGGCRATFFNHRRRLCGGNGAGG